MKQNSVLFFLIIIILGVFGLGVWFGRTQISCEICAPSDVDFSLFWEAWQTVKEKYVDKTKLDVQEMIYGAISGMVKSLDDPYTVFLKPDDTKRFIEDVKGSFEGVGMEVDVRNGQLQVVAPLEGTPAQKAGIRPGDIIIKVDGTTTAEMSVDEAVNLIRGPKGTEVTLTIYREEWGETKDIKIVRGVIDVPSNKLEIRDDGIAYLKIYHFSENAGYDFREAAIKILQSDSKKIILDLRDNPGGYLEVAQDIAGWFLDRGQVVTIEDFGEGKEQNKYLAEGNAKLVSYPIVILINKGSASGSEILAGALRDDREIKLIGETSFGKGSVQELTKLKGGSSLKVTIAKWLTPKGDLITGKGLEPDVKVEMTMDDLDNDKDPQLDKALEILKIKNK
ncbi:MAG: S41 family peptidase [Candidatus Pacebacteria bacterium]|nr:S41 family peptidase [Candidatus Paceibacterota bacterium]